MSEKERVEKDTKKPEKTEVKVQGIPVYHEGDVEELRDVLKIVREEIPGLLKDITGPLKELLGIAFTTTEEEAEKKAKAIAKFYKELINAGIDKETALQMTQSNFVNPMDIITKLLESWKEMQKTGKESQQEFVKQLPSIIVAAKEQERKRGEIKETEATKEGEKTA